MFPDAGISSAVTSRGSGSTKEGCCLADRRSAAKVDEGRAKCTDCGLEAWRRRQSTWTSFAGSGATLSSARKESRVLTPGGGLFAEAADACVVGGGGGAGHGEPWEESGVDDTDDAEGDGGGEGGGVRGAVAPGTEACFRRVSILSL